MKKHYKTLYSFLAFSFFTIASAQNTVPAIEWQKAIGGTDVDHGHAAKQTSDGGYTLAGATNSSDGDADGNTGINNNFWIVKTDSSGTIAWQTSMPADLIEIANDVIQTSDGGYIAVGYKEMITSQQHNINDIWAVKLSSTGAVEWEETYGGSSNEFANAVIQTTDGNYVIAGAAYSVDGDVTMPHPGGDAWVIKIDSQGTLLWNKALGGTSTEEANDIEQTADGGFIMTGFTYSNNGDVSGNHGHFDSWVVKLDAAGTISWQKALGGSFDDRGLSIKQTPEGGYIMAGISSSDDGDVTGFHGLPGQFFVFDFWAVKLDDMGNITWSKVYGGAATDEAQDVVLTEDGGYALAGLTRSNDGDVTGNNGHFDYWVIKINADGNLAWQKAMGGSLDDSAFTIDATADNGFIVFGGAASPNDGDITDSYYPSADMWLVKLEGYEILNISSNMLTNVNLCPNPAVNNTVTLSGVPAGSAIKITDAMGKVIYAANPPLGELIINTSGFSGGVYLVSIADGKAAITKKLIVSH